MSPRTPEQFESIRQERKEALVASAFKLFANKGFTTTSVMDIARDAGVSKGLLYNYFTNKDELVKEIVVTGASRMISDMNLDVTQEMTRERFIQMIEQNIEMLKQNTDYWKLYIAVITQPAVAELVKDEIFALLEPFFILVTKYYQDKGIKNPMAYALLLGAIFDGIGIDYMFSPDMYPLDDIKDLIIEKFV